jgi:hypothetical protein
MPGTALPPHAAGGGTPRRNRGETFNFLPPAKPTAGHAGSRCLLAPVTRHAPPSTPGPAPLCAVRWLLPGVRRTRPLCTGVASPSRGTAAPPAPALHPWPQARSGQRHAGAAPVYRPPDPASLSGGTAPAHLFLPALSPSQAQHWCKVGTSEARKRLRERKVAACMSRARVAHQLAFAGSLRQICRQPAALSRGPLGHPGRKTSFNTAVEPDNTSTTPSLPLAQSTAPDSRHCAHVARPPAPHRPRSERRARVS